LTKKIIFSVQIEHFVYAPFTVEFKEFLALFEQV